MSNEIDDKNTDPVWTLKFFSPVKNKFLNILNIDFNVNEKAVGEYHKRLESLESNHVVGVALFKELIDIEINIHEFKQQYPWAEHKYQWQGFSHQRVKEDMTLNQISNSTAKCPAKDGIIIRYGIDVYKPVSSYAYLLSDIPLNERFVPFSNLKGELIPHTSNGPDFNNAIKFQLDKNGEAQIKECQPDNKYYVRFNPIDDPQEIKKWMNGYKDLIADLSEFLESEWFNVLLPRWQEWDKIQESFIDEVATIHTNVDSGIKDQFRQRMDDFDEQLKALLLKGLDMVQITMLNIDRKSVV